MTTVIDIADLPSKVGEHLGYSAWQTITQEQVNLFADATGDHQWIHVDPERAKSGPFGGLIAHGYLTLSLIPASRRDPRLGRRGARGRPGHPRHRLRAEGRPQALLRGPGGLPLLPLSVTVPR